MDRGAWRAIVPWDGKELDTTEPLRTLHYVENTVLHSLAASIYIPTNSVGGFPFFHILSSIIVSRFFW